MSYEDQTKNISVEEIKTRLETAADYTEKVIREIVGDGFDEEIANIRGSYATISYHAVQRIKDRTGS